ncbi:hypothetical protein [Neisseria polysaccharea]|uniref:hypothetical protein n=1 Tax=Neisseria polysaccharea TaxID=489 RepID=UPI0027E1866D|nr:hypothetical protein [Neisseria polysaccharea]
MQEPLYSLSWQATVRSGKRVSLAPRFVIENQQRKVGRDPLFICGSVRVIFLNGYAAPFAVASYGMARKPEIQTL